jgi:hypothetical protein
VSDFEGDEVIAKNYLECAIFRTYRRYKECIRIVNGLEKRLKLKIPKQEQHWQIKEGLAVFGASDETLPHGWTVITA